MQVATKQAAPKQSAKAQTETARRKQLRHPRATPLVALLAFITLFAVPAG